MRNLIQIASTKTVIMPSLRIAAVVGTVLNLINQGEVVMAGEGISIPHLLLNYAVPFCVATYSAARNEQRRQH